MLVRNADHKWIHDAGKRLRKMVLEITRPWEKDIEASDEDIHKLRLDIEKLHTEVDRWKDLMDDVIRQERDFWYLVQDVQNEQEERRKCEGDSSTQE